MFMPFKAKSMDSSTLYAFARNKVLTAHLRSMLVLGKRQSILRDPDTAA